MKFDLDYILKTIANISALPVRLYKNEKMIKYYSIISFPVDPVKLYEKDILKSDKSIYIYNAPHFFFYGAIKYQNYEIIIGPACISFKKDYVKDLAFDLELPLDLYQHFEEAIEMTTSMPYLTFIEMLLMINYVLNNEKLELSNFIDLNEPTLKENQLAGNEVNQKYHFNSLNVEKEILEIVHNGDLNALNLFIKNMQTIRAGQIANTPIRNEKNLFIVSVTLISREAIKAGVNPEDALRMSDAFIMKLETLNSVEEITNLNLECITAYTKKVSLFKGNNNSEIANKVTTYILENLSKNITLDELASYFYMSKSNLSFKFKKETGESLNQFILEKKIQISLELLKDKKKSIAYISEYLGFSSSPHFTKTFLKVMKKTPSEYREELKSS